MGKDNFKLVANNKKAYHDYFIDDTYEAGISLAGTEVKSVRMGKCSIKEAFVKVEKNEEVYVYGMHISPYEKGNIFNKDPLRPRKLLLHKYEIRKIAGKTAEKGYSISNIDATIIAQAPKMSGHIDEMRKNIAAACDIDVDCVSVKATTEEKLGFTGSGEGISAHSVCLIEK